ncbi:MAG: ATP-binding protein [Halobacteriota archaeon]|nr:ATP-binding protein [Halobacteriota archaeon]
MTKTKNTTVLLVEDNPGDARLIKEMLKFSSTTRFELTQVESLKDAIEVLEEESFDIILSDLGLPDSWGLDTFNKLHIHVPRVPTIVLTGLNDDVTGTRAVREGAQDYLIKGQVDGDILSRAIHYAIERKKSDEALRESEEKYSALVELSPDGIVLLQAGKVIFANNSIYRLFDIDESDLIGGDIFKLMNGSLKDAMDVLNGQERSLIINNLSEAARGNITARTYRLPSKRKSGDIIWIEVHVTPIMYKGITSELILFKDITEQKEAEQSIKEKNKELQVMGEELQELNLNLENKVKERTIEVENLLKQKDEFVNQLGHDLKSPLTPLVTLLPIIEEREKDSELKELLGISIENVNFMKELVIKTLSLARLNAPNTKFNIDEVKLSKEVKTIFYTKQQIFIERGISTENKVPEGLIVRADKLRLDELFDNLITNAIKYSNEGGSITIDAEDNGDFVKVSIKDTGVGMAEEQLSHIFEEFYKVDPSRHDLDSSGLGLSICKRIVEKHGGKIWAESPGEGKGTTFYFTIPALRVEEEEMLVLAY